jgi:hypothetical protein
VQLINQILLPTGCWCFRVRVGRSVGLSQPFTLAPLSPSKLRERGARDDLVRRLLEALRHCYRKLASQCHPISEPRRSPLLPIDLADDALRMGHGFNQRTRTAQHRVEVPVRLLADAFWFSIGIQTV